MSFSAAATFLLAIIIFAITPGPGVFAILGRALMSGARSCVTLCLGMAISDIVYLLLACMGLATIAENFGDLFTIIRFAGAAYLFYLAWKMWHAPLNIHLDTKEKAKGDAMMSFIQGFLISASNPKVILFYIAFLPSFIDLTSLTTDDIVLVSLLTLIGLMIGLMAIAISASTARRQLKSTKAMKRLNRTAGSIMAGAGAYLLTRS